MKIAILADPLDNQSAGVHTYTKQFIHSLIQNDTENKYLLIREKKDPNLPYQQIAIPNIRIPIGFASVRLFFIIPMILRFHKVDAVFEPAHFGPFNLPKRIKRITMIHDLTPILFPQYHRFHSQMLQRVFLKGILRKADLILSNSQNTTKDLMSVFPFTKSKIKTILLGKDVDFRPCKSRLILEQKQISSPYFLYTGTIEPRKNLSLLLEAYQQFKEKFDSDVKLLIVGKNGWFTDKFHSLLELHPFRKDIIMMGFVSKNELIEIYSHAMALVYPSLYEGFGLPILEALSCGTQVICSNSSSLPEVGGEISLYFDPTDAGDLLVKMMYAFEIYGHKNEKQEAYLSQARKFSWSHYAQSFQQALKNL